ncbi:MAG: ribonucleoside-triphosphate reductase, adenosylcobalamin-dependent [Cyanobacteriota bacterium]
MQRGEVIALQHGWRLGQIPLQQGLGGGAAGGPAQILDVDAGSGGRQLAHGLPEHGRVVQMVQQAVADHGAEAARQADIGQQVVGKAQAGLQVRLLCQCQDGQLEHGGGSVDAQHAGVGVTLRQEKADVAGTAAEINQTHTEAGGEELLQTIDQGLIARTEVRGGVGERLLGVVHQLRLGNAIHGGATGEPQCGHGLRHPPVVARSPCDPHRWRYGAETADHPNSVTLSAPQAASTGAASQDATSRAADAALNAPRPDFPATAPAANPVFYRTYSRKLPAGRESWQQVAERNLEGLRTLGHLNEQEVALLRRMQHDQRALPSGRWLWIGGTPWIEQSENFSGAYNCTSTNLVDWDAFGLMMDLAMMGCGTGAIIEPHLISRLPVVRNRLQILSVSDIGVTAAGERQEHTSHTISGQQVAIKVGDTRRGWVDSYQLLLELCSDERFDAEAPIEISIDLSDVRPVGETLKGFGGMANPVKLKDLYGRVAQILAKAQGRQLTSVECCLLIDEAAVTIVAGNIRRSAGMRQFAADDLAAAGAKDNLWQQDSDGNWRIDPERDALRMANHTRVFHSRPSRETVLEAVTKQFQSGEGAIQFAPEAIARSNADLLPTPELRDEFIGIYCDQGRDEAGRWLRQHADGLDDAELEHRLGRYGLNPCGEILGADFHCNLAEIHLNRIDPEDHVAQEEAFTAGGLAVACLLNHRFEVARYRQSRAWDPIVGVSFTGLFDFFVHAFGTAWLNWWEAGRPDTEEGRAFKAREAEYLSRWKEIVNKAVWDYCDRHGLRRPNRCTTVQPAGTKSLLTGASPGWHPPKAQRFIRRITFRKNDPVALACLDYGYTIVPSQSDKDDQGRLLDDPFDPRCSEWLVEIPTEVSWANIPGADAVEINNFSAMAQFDFYMQVQRYYTAHNTSATVEFREHEIEPLAEAIHRAIDEGEGYISAALLARFDANATFPRLPFEPIDHATYERLQAEVVQRRRTGDFFEALQRYDSGELMEAGPAGCDSDKCLLPLAKPQD